MQTEVQSAGAKCRYLRVVRAMCARSRNIPRADQACPRETTTALLQIRDAPAALLISRFTDQGCTIGSFISPPTDQGCTSGPPYQPSYRPGMYHRLHYQPSYRPGEHQHHRPPLIILHKTLHMCESGLEASAAVLGVAAGPHPVFYLVL
jgi:hypothetical protein